VLEEENDLKNMNLDEYMKTKPSKQSQPSVDVGAVELNQYLNSLIE